MSTSEKSFFIIITFTHTEQEKEGEERGREGGKREGENKGKGRGGSGNEKSPAAAASGSLRSGISGYQVSGLSLSMSLRGGKICTRLELSPKDAPRKKAPA